MRIKNKFLIFLLISLGDYNVYAQLHINKVQKDIFKLSLPKSLEDFNIYIKIEKELGLEKVTLFKKEDENFENISDQSKLSIDTFHSWVNDAEKGKVAQSFESALTSGENILQSPQYQYFLQSSPDNKHYLIYHYLFNFQVLKCSLIILDQQLNIENKLIIPLENEIINYGFYITHPEEIFSVNTIDNSGIYIQKFNLSSGSNNFMSIEAGSLSRRDVKVFQKGDDTYLGNLCEDKSGKLIGIMYSQLNFKNNKVEKVIYHQFKDELKSVLAQHAAMGFFYINDFEIIEKRYAKFTLQRKNIVSPSYNLNPYHTEDELLWKPRKQKQVSLEKLIIEIYKEGTLVREEIIK